MNLNKDEKIVLLFGVVLACFAFVFAAHVITISDGSASFGYDEDVVNTYNITVNNTDTTSAGWAANITDVNITLPSNFTFIASSNGTDAGGNHQFLNTSSVLSWINLTDGLVQNQTQNHFWFDANASAVGTYNITVTTYNTTGAFSSNVTVIINTTIPGVSYGSNSDADYSNKSSNSTYANVTVVESNESSITFVLYNLTAQVNSTTFTDGSTRTINWTNLPDGNYTYNVTVNDTAGNSNTTATRTILIDTTAPSVSLSASVTATSITITVTATDALTGVNGDCSVDRSGATVSGNTITETGLGCGVSYTYNINCVDYAGNIGSASESFSTSSCSSSSDTGGSGTTTTWSNTFVDNSQELKEKAVERSLGEKERVRLKVSGSTHHVGVTDVTNSEVTIEVSSTPQEATLEIGESAKFDVSDDNIYDILVTLNDIVGSDANLTIEGINETIVVGDDDGDIDDGDDTSVGDEGLEATEGEVSKKGLWIALIIIAIFVVLVVLSRTYFKKENKNK